MLTDIPKVESPDMTAVFDKPDENLPDPGQEERQAFLTARFKQVAPAPRNGVSSVASRAFDSAYSNELAAQVAEIRQAAAEQEPKQELGLGIVGEYFAAKERAPAIGMKNDSGKPPVSLVPQALVYGAARAYDFGAKKYARHNYRLGIKASRLLDAAMRHLLEKAEGATADPESGLDPLDHAAAALGMLMDTLHRVQEGKLDPLFDDLYKVP